MTINISCIYIQVHNCCTKYTIASTTMFVALCNRHQNTVPDSFSYYMPHTQSKAGFVIPSVLDYPGITVSYLKLANVNLFFLEEPECV